MDFSHGAQQLNESIEVRANYKLIQLGVIASVEPGCKVITEPVNGAFIILVIKGSDSHHYIKPWQYCKTPARNEGNDVTLTVIKQTS